MVVVTEEKQVGDERNEKITVEDKSSTEDAGVKKGSSIGEVEANHIDISETEGRAILSKVDYRLVPLLALLYLVAFIDRSNSKFAQADYTRA
jgi:hypothetical protein